MAGAARGPMCSTRCGPDWIDDGTACRSKSEPAAPLLGYSKPTASQLAKQEVLKVLAQKGVGKIRFRYDSFTMGPWAYARVVRKIRGGQISVEYSWQYQSSAYYCPTKNRIYLGFTRANTLTRRALIVHECTHAAFDVLRYSNATVTDSECAAHLAQCMFARFHSPKPDDPQVRLSDDNTKKDWVFEVAWHLGGIFLKGQTPTPKQFRILESAVLNHPNYKGKTNYSGWNGV